MLFISVSTSTNISPYTKHTHFHLTNRLNLPSIFTCPWGRWTLQIPQVLSRSKMEPGPSERTRTKGPEEGTSLYYVSDWEGMVDVDLKGFPRPWKSANR